MKTARIICVGNRHVQGDDFGPRVFDCLAAQDIPDSVDIVDGGLGGLGLLPFLESCNCAVFVDAVSGFAAPGELMLLSGAEVARQCSGGFDHAAGLPYLLRAMPAVLDVAPRTVKVVGHEGIASEGAVRQAARLALRLAVDRPDHACVA